MTTELKGENYAKLIAALKQEIAQARIRAHLAVNRELRFIGGLAPKYSIGKLTKGGDQKSLKISQKTYVKNFLK